MGFLGKAAELRQEEKVPKIFSRSMFPMIEYGLWIMNALGCQKKLSTLRILTPQKWLFWEPQNTPGYTGSNSPLHWRVLPGDSYGSFPHDSFDVRFGTLKDFHVEVITFQALVRKNGCRFTSANFKQHKTRKKAAQMILGIGWEILLREILH